MAAVLARTFGVEGCADPTDRACRVCGAALGVSPSCLNQWCGREDRWFSGVWSAASHSGAVRRAILSYKYQSRTEWSRVFARMLVGYLDDHMPWFDDYDFLLGAPSYTGRGARRHWDHIDRVVQEAAAISGALWRFERGLISKDAETPAMASLGLSGRRTCAAGPLRAALRVTAPSCVEGRRLIVVDDVFTEGSTLREIARALIRCGAVEVAGLTIARSIWSGQT
jgi:predicted amidophosphoribosyltransferase